MSGIAGIVRQDGGAVLQATLDRIIAAAPGVGHDGIFTRLSGAAGLIRFALATTPEAKAEGAPSTSPDTDGCIAFDGRIDNREACLALLDRTSAARLANRPDGEIVLALHDRLGDRVLDRLVGDYAFAIWSPREQRLLLARSPLGWRPLFWTWDGRRLGFATEPAMLVKGLDLPREINEGAIGEALGLRFVHQTETFWRHVQRLPPGSALKLDAGGIRQSHWHNPVIEDWSTRSEAEHIDRFSALFDQSLAAAMRSRTDVAAHISGGLDSSSVACRATALFRAGRLARQIRPIVGRYPGERHDETRWNRLVETHLGIEAMVVGETPWDRNGAEAWVSDTLQLPLRPNALATFGASCERLHTEGIRVLLTGEGGDDWLSGSRSHWPDLLRHGRLPQLFREASPGASPLAAVRAMLANGMGPLVSKKKRHAALAPHYAAYRGLPEALSADWAKRIGLEERWSGPPPTPQLAGFAQRQRYQRYILPRGHINFDNALAMAARNGVELRHPFHDLRLTEFLMGAAGGFIRRNGEKKYLLRQAMSGTLPDEIRMRQDKAEFSTPTVDAVLGYFRERQSSDLMGVKLGWLDRKVVDDQVRRLAAWREDTTSAARPDVNANAVWMMVSVDLWLRNAARI